MRNRRPDRPPPRSREFSITTPTGNGSRTVVIEQGYQIGRPSLITLLMTLRDGQLVGAAIGGEAIAVTGGTVEA